MRRAAAIVLITICIAAAVLALLMAYALSPIGRSGLASIAERRIAGAVGGEVIVGSVSGDLATRIELNDVRFLDEGAEWGTIKTIVIDWSPEALISRRVEISKAVIEDAVLLARPPGRGRNAPIKGLELPARLPALTIERIELRNLLVSGQLRGVPLRLDGEGALEMGGSAISVRARVAEKNRRDTIDIDLNRSDLDAAPILRVKVNSAPDGAIAGLMRSGGAVDVTLEGSGPPAAYLIAFDGTAGAYGALSGALTADIEAPGAIDFDFTASPGARFDRWRTDIGDKIDVKGALFPTERGARLELRELKTALGDVTGGAEWRNKGRALASAVVNLEAKFTPTWRRDLQEAAGNQAFARVSLERTGRDLAGTASIVTPALTATLQDLSTNLRSQLTGDLSVSIAAASSLAAPLKSTVRGSGSLSFEANESIRLTALELSTGNGASFKGDVSYQTAERQFAIDGAIAAAASALRALTPAVTPRGAASGVIKASGSLNDFDIRLSLTAPRLQLGRSAWPASSISVALAHLPASPSGAVSLRAMDGSFRSFARVHRAPGGVLSVSEIDHSGAGFALTGEVTIRPETWEGSIDLRYVGAEGAEPWPGLVLSGEAMAKGTLGKGRADNRIDIKASTLRTMSLSLETMSFVARGSVDKLSFEASAAALSTMSRARAERLKITGVASVGRRTELSIVMASAEVQGAQARLNRPAKFTFGGGVAVDALSMRVGDAGSIDFSGAADPYRWRAAATVRNLEISPNGSTLDLDLKLDTDRVMAASGAFAVASGSVGKRDAALNGQYDWDGRRLTVVSGDSPNGALDLDLDLPLTLRRADRLSVSLNGAIIGNARYSGRAETIALFLPLALQSLEGDLAFSGTLGGTVKDPRVAGDFSLTGGAYTEVASGLSIVGIDVISSAAATSTSSSLIFKASASGAGQTAKTITAAGKIDLSGGVTVSADITLDGARFAAGPVERVDATGTLKIDGAADDLLVSGDVAIGALQAKLFSPENLGLVDIDVVAIGIDGRPVAEAAAVRRRAALRYAVRINADDNVLVSGRGLDSEWRANAQLSGNSERPLILGTMILNRGDLEFAGRRFDLTGGSIGFDALAPNDPSIALRAERKTRDGTTVTIIISGRSSALKVSLESTPPRPSEDVMALILFDKPADELSAFESLQVADALTQLGGVGVFGGKGVTGAARDALGLDLLNLDLDQTDSSASLLTVGKYVTDGLFVSASQNARGENGSLRIEYEIGQSFTVETELRQDGDQTVSANWKKDF